MRKTIITTLGALLIAGSAANMATASARHIHRAPVAASEQCTRPCRMANHRSRSKSSALSDVFGVAPISLMMVAAWFYPITTTAALKGCPGRDRNGAEF